ncbi:BRO-N domain-containing protein [Aggregatibacter actinomycetemcomitans]|uniref:BRO-N domain-containing protein n=1 Tax=Aggregatibacter actinomycetemcomitans TaxID=714 RepID=UPI001E2B5687|nr:Bro-N domain-containing protein [Aggregatibacter actinomycetemcomitans]
MTILTFQSTTLSAIHQNNQIWLTVTEIGKALGYSDPFKSVKNIYDRHADEFTPQMTALIDMRTNGGIQKVRIFSLRGAHLIGMLSHTKVAKDFRRWVLDILDREAQQPKQLALPQPEKTYTVPLTEYRNCHLKTRVFLVHSTSYCPFLSNKKALTWRAWGWLGLFISLACICLDKIHRRE